MIRLKLLFLCAMLLICSCASPNRIRTNFKTDDLDQSFVKEFKYNSNYFYKFDSNHAVDYMVSIVRMNVLSAHTTISMGEILLSFGLIGKEDSFNCDTFFSKLTIEEQTLVKSKMLKHPFICNQQQYTTNDVLESFPIALSDQISSYRVADCHWAWFSATGDTAPLTRILDNYLYNSNACMNCITWSFSSNAEQNQDVKQFLVEYMKGKNKIERERLLILMPKD